MKSRTHMQDQVRNRIAELMDEQPHYNWDEIFHNAATLTLVTLFLSLGLNW